MTNSLAPQPTNQTPTLNPVLRDFWTAPARNRVLYGGRNSTKSWDAAGFAIFLAQYCKLRFLCTRQFQNKIEESVYTLLKVQIHRFGLQDQFTILNNKITHNITGSEFVFYGLWRHVEEIKSLEGIDIHWAEEAHLLSEVQWDIVEPTLRKSGSQHWIIFNPRFATDFVYKRFVISPPADTVVRKINYTENQFITDTSLKVIEAMRTEDPDKHRHVYLGEPMADDERVIIKREWIVAAIDAHKKLGIKPSGARRIGFDVADDGADKNATVAAYGLLCMNVQEWQGKPDDLLGSCSRVYAQARALQAAIHYDNIGVGASCGSKFKELNTATRARIKYKGFGAGGKKIRPDDEYDDGITNRDYFSNLKAQAWWGVADRFRNTFAAVHHGQTFREDQLISINAGCEHLEQLIDELSTPHRDFDDNGKVKVESKDDLTKRHVKSPNLAESFIIAYSPLVAGVVDYGKL
jgi:phage terminase large subunit